MSLLQLFRLMDLSVVVGWKLFDIVRNVCIVNLGQSLKPWIVPTKLTIHHSELSKSLSTVIAVSIRYSQHHDSRSQ